MNPNIEIGKLGLIKTGDNAGFYIKIVDDSVSTGGFLILLCMTKDMKKGFDDWVENTETLEGYFATSKWVIDWLE